MAAELFRFALRRRVGKRWAESWSVRSGGTHAIEGARVHPLAVEALGRRGVPVAAGGAHAVTVDDLERADLVLTAGRRQRSWAVERCPSAVRRTFTIRQFARLCSGGATSARLPEVTAGGDLLDLAAVGRTVVQPGSELDDTVVDPIGGGSAEFEECAGLIAACVEEITRPFVR
jgi:protein-tyrosine phosphatase